jgi:hypothetical protein
MKHFTAISAVTFATLLGATSVHAEIYCVSAAAQLRTALSDAATSTSASEIRIRKGFYALPAASAQSASLNYSAVSDLKISGGWEGSGGACTVESAEQESTVLSAQGVGRLLNIYLLNGSQTNIELKSLSFRDGAGVSGLAGCVNVESDASANGTVNIDNNSFRLCRTSALGAALVVEARAIDVRVRNNLFTDNVSQLGIVQLLGLGGSVLYFSNNTLVNNPQLDLDGGPGGIQISAQANDLVWFSNNVLWKNGSSNGYDLYVGSGTPIVLNNNLIGSTTSLPVGAVNNATLSIDPGFVGPADFRPSTNSPMRNSGTNPNGGQIGLDLAGDIRVQGARIDRGAFEYSELFFSGFE